MVISGKVRGTQHREKLNWLWATTDDATRRQRNNSKTQNGLKWKSLLSPSRTILPTIIHHPRDTAFNWDLCMCWLTHFCCCFFRNPNWWRRRTKLERGLLVLSTILILVAGTLFGLKIFDSLHTQSGGDPNAQTTATPQATAFHGDTTTMNKVPEVGNTKGKVDAESVCLTKECIHTASTVLSKMKSDVEPCDNFYEFACGSYIEEQTIPDDKVSISTFSVISDKLQEQLKEIITADRPDSEPKHFRLPNLLYRACMNKSEYLGQLILRLQTDCDSSQLWLSPWELSPSRRLPRNSAAGR